MPDFLRSGTRPRILFLGAQMATGGSQRVLLLQADWFFKQGYSVAVAFLYDKEHLLPAWCQTYDFPIYDLGFGAPTDNLLAQARYFIRGIFRLFRLLKQAPCTAIVAFAHHANLIGLPLAWLAGVPNRIASHRGKIEGLSPVIERLHAIMINSPITSCLVVVAERVREDAISEGVNPARIVTIANGVVLPKVDADDIVRVKEELGLNGEDLILLSVGRLRYQKAHSVLLKAFPAVLAEFPHIQMLIAGDGLLRLFGQGELESYGIEDCRVTQIGETYYLTFTAVSRDTECALACAAHGLARNSPPRHDPPASQQRLRYFSASKLAANTTPSIGPAARVIGGNYIWIAESPDLIHWGNHRCLAHSRPGMWDSARVGAGAAPIRTPEGWLEIYHGADAKNRYCLGALLLDLEAPWKVVARSREPIMEPIADYERTGFFGNVVFTNGHVVDGDTLTIYYGASDSVICGAQFFDRRDSRKLSVEPLP